MYEGRFGAELDTVIFPMALAPLCSEQIARVQVLVFTGNSHGVGDRDCSSLRMFSALE